MMADELESSLYAQIAELKAQVQECNAIPVAAIVRYWRNSNYDVRRANDNGCTPEMFDEDDATIEAWVNAMEGAQHE